MDVPVPRLLALIATRAEETLQVLVPLACLAVAAVLLSRQVRHQLGRMGTLVALAVALLVGATALYALGRV
ncbi:hypothetical protein SAMN05216223_12261 [Actinacidiphila yanglinensis]|uniref:Uncharacterized protein n=1 Tax=Actinacidiphila yanglinensis TaxID=310779 RepID=A0A1H6E0M5_9ACTN|nr:hypothetical protein [Actinacidiphila yanglinensis]SEG90703.1 hypothetical protein SAMN05216223_12261 [Actinacidiphila yanglinensis]